jgi:hypothetical protein
LLQHTQRVVRSALLAAVALIASAGVIEACTCYSSDSPAACELYTGAGVAFVGRAIHVPPDRAAGRVRFRLTQALKGVAGSEVSVLNDESGVGCGYQFEQGQDYVVFATRNAEGEIEIARCSSTIWMVRAPEWAYAEFRRRSAEAVAFAQSFRHPAAGGRIFGEVRVRVPFSAPHEEFTKPIDGATVFFEARTKSADPNISSRSRPRCSSSSVNPRETSQSPITAGVAMHPSSRSSREKSPAQSSDMTARR